jgi:hypothetical protein
MTAKMAEALRLMRASPDPRMAVTITQPTRHCTGGPFINLRTARALEAAGLAAFERGGDEPLYEWFSLTDAGRAAADALDDEHEAPAANVRNTAGCCDGDGQVHHGEGALSWVTLCHDPACVARREAAWAAECGETPASERKDPA